MAAGRSRPSTANLNFFSQVISLGIACAFVTKGPILLSGAHWACVWSASEASSGCFKSNSLGGLDAQLSKDSNR